MKEKKKILFFCIILLVLALVWMICFRNPVRNNSTVKKVIFHSKEAVLSEEDGKKLTEICSKLFARRVTLTKSDYDEQFTVVFTDRTALEFYDNADGSATIYAWARNKKIGYENGKYIMKMKTADYKKLQELLQTYME